MPSEDMLSQERTAVYKAVVRYGYQSYTKNDNYITELLWNISRGPGSPDFYDSNRFMEEIQKNRKLVNEAERLAAQENEKLEGSLYDLFYSETKDVLMQVLPLDLQSAYDLDVSVRMLDSAKGSVIAFFEVTIAALSTIAIYKDLNDSFELIRSQSERALKMFLNRVRHERLTGTTTVEVSLYSSSNSVPQGTKISTQNLVITPDKSSDNTAKPVSLVENKPVVDSHSEKPVNITLSQPVYGNPIRDDFFYFLLICSIVEFIIIVLLVSGAVVHTYF